MEWVSEKLEICQAGRFLLENQLVSRTWGNLSILVDDDTFIISPSGKSYMETQAKDIAEVELETLKFHGNSKPSSEMAAHKVIYNGIEDAKACVHTHQRFVTAVSVLANSYLQAKKCQKSDKISEKLINTVPQDIGESFALYGMAGSEQLAENIGRAIGRTVKMENSFIILANHGAICWGKSMDEAIEVALNLENKCQRFLDELGCVYVKGKEFVDFTYKKVGNKYICFADQPEVKAVKAGSLAGYIDDFGQIVGESIQIEKDGAVKLEADNLEDLEAMYEIAGKNALAWQIASMMNAQAIPKQYLKEMHQKYVNYYSKLK